MPPTPPAVRPEPKTPGAPGAFPPAVDAMPKPDLTPPGGIGTPAAFTKPGGSTEVKPTVPEAAPTTGFDVDLHDPKANDSYESISLEFYNDRRFAAALKAFNRNQPLTGGRLVEVPPIHILKKRYPAQVGGVVPVGSTGGAPSSAPQWGPAGDKSDPVPARATGTFRNTYVIPAGSGMSMKGVAKFTLGNEQRWQDIYFLNPGLRPDELLPPGTELKLPSDAHP
jgi:hypothetical protein